MFWFKKKELHIDCFTAHSAAYNLFKIEKANKFIPEWWKKIETTAVINPKHPFPGATIKRCRGFIDLYRHGLVLPAWSDFLLNVGREDFVWQWADQSTELVIHSEASRGEYLNWPWVNCKIVVPWAFACKEDIPWMFSPILWNTNKPIDIVMPTGIVDYKYQHAVNINFFFEHRKNPYTLGFDAGQPLVHMVPLTDRKLVIHNHLVSKEEFNRHYLPYGSFSFVDTYNKIKRIVNKDAKCPFHQ